MTVPTYTLAIKAIPNATRTEVAGWLGKALKVKVHAPAMDGRANDELIKFLAEKLNLPKRDVTLQRGEKSRHKVVSIVGLTHGEVTSRLLDSLGS